MLAVFLGGRDTVDHSNDTKRRKIVWDCGSLERTSLKTRAERRTCSVLLDQQTNERKEREGVCHREEDGFCGEVPGGAFRRLKLCICLCVLSSFLLKRIMHSLFCPSRLVLHLCVSCGRRRAYVTDGSFGSDLSASTGRGRGLYVHFEGVNFFVTEKELL